MKKRIITSAIVLFVFAGALSLNISAALTNAKSVSTPKGVTPNSEAYTPGDVNGDGNVDVSDCVYIRMIVSKKLNYLDRADINYDDEITEKDAQILSEYIVGYRDKLPEDPHDSDIDLPIIN